MAAFPFWLKSMLGNTVKLTYIQVHMHPLVRIVFLLCKCAAVLIYSADIWFSCFYFPFVPFLCLSLQALLWTRHSPFIAPKASSFNQPTNEPNLQFTCLLSIFKCLHSGKKFGWEVTANGKSKLLTYTCMHIWMYIYIYTCKHLSHWHIFSTTYTHTHLFLHKHICMYSISCFL